MRLLAALPKMAQASACGLRANPYPAPGSIFIPILVRCAIGTLLTVVGAIGAQPSAAPTPVPKEVESASADCIRARETGNPIWYQRAAEALDRADKIAPGNFEVSKVRVTTLLGLGNLEAALEKAKALNHRVPDDIAGWGLLAEAQMALGNYEEAEKAAQWMLDLRPGNAPAFIQSARLREVFGDAEGATEFYKEALKRMPQTDPERQAWVFTQYARMRRFIDDKTGAASALQEAMKVRPDYAPALAESALLLLAQAKCDEALPLLEIRDKLSATAASQYDLAEGLDRCGRKEDARKAFAAFEPKARAGRDSLHLVFYYADHADKPVQALEIAERASAAGKDIYTLDAYAWALYRNGRIKDAKAQIDRALAVGTKDPAIVAHSAKISAALGTR